MSVEYVKTDESLPPVGVIERPRWTPGKIVLWVAIAAIAAVGLILTLVLREEPGEAPAPIALGCSDTGCVFMARGGF